MRTSRVVGLAFGVLASAATGCATSGAAASLRPQASADSVPGLAPAANSQEFRDSVIAQAIADRRGPRIAINAQSEPFGGDSRRVQGWFHADEDAYVVVGHLGADGVVRIVFPGVGDDGFVRGGHTYYLPRVFAGFTSEYRTRFAMSRYKSTFMPARWQSYDGGVGYMFAIASWRPLHLDEVRDASGWDAWELTDDEYIHDPRPAIYELASLLAGENREQYTVKFARYMGTSSFMQLASANLGFNARWPYGSVFGAGWCAGYEPLGYMFGAVYFPWVRSGSLYSGYSGGINYAYDNFNNCYRAVYTPVARVAMTPPPPPPTPAVRQPSVPAPRTPTVRRPENPQTKPLVTHIPAPTGAAGELSQQYRERGLFIADDHEPRAGHRAMDTHTDAPTARPSIQHMVDMRREPGESDRGQRGASAPTMRPGYQRPRRSPRAEAFGTMPRAYQPPTSEPAQTISAPTAPASTSGTQSGTQSGASAPMSSPRGQKPPQP